MKQISFFELLGLVENKKSEASTHRSIYSKVGSLLGMRRGIVDMWNAFMLKDAIFSENDMPLCPTTATTPPKSLISWREAKTIHKREMRRGCKNYHVDAFVHFYLDDQHFDGIRSSIWLFPKKAIDILYHFEGLIAPDFSTCADFPDPLKRWNFYRMNAFGYWAGKCGLQVISNARWGYSNTWVYCWDSICEGDMIAIGTVASDLSRLENRELFEMGIRELIRQKHPSLIIVYGSAKYKVFDEAREQGCQIIAFPSETSIRFARGCHHE